MEQHRPVGAKSSQAHILVFSPDTTLLAGLKTLLESTNDRWRISTASDPKEARVQLRTDPAMVCIGDCPEAFAETVLMLRTAGTQATNPRYFISILSDSVPDALEEAIRLRVDDVISRPPNIHLLQLKVQQAVKTQLMRRQLKTLQARLTVGEMNDLITGLPNRKRSELFIRGEIERVSRGLQGLGLALYSLDFFGVVNTAFGNPMGDRVLADISGAMQKGSRTYDMLGRWDGKVFVAAFPDTTLLGADTVCRRHVNAIRALEWTADGETFGMTTSVGLAYVPSGTQISVEEFLDWAKTASQAAKDSGRDQIVHAPGNEAYSSTSHTSGAWEDSQRAERTKS